MKRIIVDYQKLNKDILNLLVEEFPDGYDDDHIISFRNAHNDLIEAVEVKTEETIYLVKVGTYLAKAMADFGDEEDIDTTNAPVPDANFDEEE